MWKNFGQPSCNMAASATIWAQVFGCCLVSVLFLCFSVGVQDNNNSSFDFGMELDSEDEIIGNQYVL